MGKGNEAGGPLQGELLWSRDSCWSRAQRQPRWLTYGNLPFFPRGRYFENIPKGLDREGWTRGGLQPQKPGGYALNQPVTRLEATPTPTESLRRLHPHVGR